MLDVNLRRLGCCQIHRFAPRHSCSLETAPGLNEFVGAVIRAMDSHTDLSTQFFTNSEISQKLLAELVPVIYNGVEGGRAGELPLQADEGDS